MRWLALTVAATLVAGCTVASEPPEATGPSDPGAVPQSNVDVDTAQLRTQRRQAGIEPCSGIRTADTAYDAQGALPDLSLPCLGGGADVSLRELRGPLVINLFAQWCGPCREELPIYQRLHAESAENAANATGSDTGARRTRGLRVLGIDWNDTQPEGALALAEATGVTFPLLADPSASLRQDLKIRGLPGIVFVDEDGRVTKVQFTVVRSYEQLSGLVEEHLGVTV